AAGRDLREELVRARLLVERLVEQVSRLTEVELAGERARRAVGGDLVVLDALCGADQRRVADGGVAPAGDDLLPFRDQALHALARLGDRAADLGTDLLEPANVVARLFQVVLERLPQLIVRGGLRQ